MPIGKADGGKDSRDGKIKIDLRKLMGNPQPSSQWEYSSSTN